jgi:hypothetical protein
VQLLVDLLEDFPLVDQVAPVELLGPVVARLEHPDGCPSETDLEVIAQDDLEDDDEAGKPDNRAEKADDLSGDFDSGIHTWTSCGKGIEVTCELEIRTIDPSIGFSDLLF